MVLIAGTTVGTAVTLVVSLTGSDARNGVDASAHSVNIKEAKTAGRNWGGISRHDRIHCFQYSLQRL